MKPISKVGQWSRGLIYVVIAFIGALVADESFRASVVPLVLAYMGASVAALIALRAYMDQSTDSQTTPVEVVNAPNDVLAVTPKADEQGTDTTATRA